MPGPLRWKLTHVGVATALAPAFYEKLSDGPLAVASGVNLALPGISLAPGGTALPTGVVVPKDDSRTSEGNVVAAGGVVTVSPVQGIREVGSALLGRLRALVGDDD